MDAIIRGTGSAEQHAKLLLDSYSRLTGKELLPLESDRSVIDQLNESSIVILSHGTEPNPVLNYGNCMALRLWEMGWGEFIATPSRQTAETAERGERDEFLRKVSENGFVDDYTGVRISSTGKRFYMINATVWNLTDEAGVPKGQAAAFSEYKYL